MTLFHIRSHSVVLCNTVYSEHSLCSHYSNESLFAGNRIAVTFVCNLSFSVFAPYCFSSSHPTLLGGGDVSRQEDRWESRMCSLTALLLLVFCSQYQCWGGEFHSHCHGVQSDTTFSRCRSLMLTQDKSLS